MKLPQTALAFTCLLLAPIGLAHADPANTVEVTLVYDADSLNTAEGTAETLDFLTQQAKTACTYKVPVSGASRIDDTCVDLTVERAVGSISNSALNGAYRLATQPSSLSLTADNNSSVTNE